MFADVRFADPDAVPGGLDAIEAVYREAFVASGGTARADFLQHFAVHRLRTAFRFLAAVDAGELVGFAYGYVGHRGEWWPDWLLAHADAAVVEPWLDGEFEVCELAVAPSAQGRGLGRRLFEQLIADPPSNRGLLTTERVNQRARALYESCGWSVVVEDLDGVFCLYGCRFGGPRHLAR